MFDDRQLVTGLPRTMVGGLQRTRNLTVNAKGQTIYTGSGPRDRVIAFKSSRRVSFYVGLIGMIICHGLSILGALPSFIYSRRQVS